MPNSDTTTFDPVLQSYAAGVREHLNAMSWMLEPSPEQKAKWAAEKAREYEAPIETIPLGHGVYVTWPNDSEDTASGWETLLDRQTGVLFGIDVVWICFGTDGCREIGPAYRRGDRVRARRPA